MNGFTKMTGLLILTLAMSFNAFAKESKKAKTEKKETATSAQTFTLNPETSSIKWLGKKVTGQHEGTIALKSGSIEMDKSNVKAGVIDIDMTTIKNVDIKDAEFNKKLTDHLNSEDFFATAKNPVATLKIKSAKEIKDNPETTHELTGDLTIKGITKEITFPAKVVVKDGKATASGKMTIDRTKYDIKYGSGQFFQNLGDKMINDNFDLSFEVSSK